MNINMDLNLCIKIKTVTIISSINIYSIIILIFKFM